MRLNLIPISIFIVILLFIGIATLKLGNERPHPLINKDVPAFNLPLALKNIHGFSSQDLKGGYNLINIFASWCATCKIEHKFLEQLNKQKIINIYGIAWRDKEKDLENFIKENGNPYKKIGNDFNGKTIISLGVTGAPESFLISPEGKIIAHYSGALNEDIWNSKFKPLISR